MPSVAGDNPSAQIERYGCITLSSFAQRPGCIDLSPVGHLVLQAQDTLHVLMPNLGFSHLLKSSDTIKSHHEHTQDIPVFHYPISIKSCPQDTSKAGSHREAYGLAYDSHFLDAKWSPSMLGPLESPLLAALTTHSQIILFRADTNQFQGPWKQFVCLDGGAEHHILCMTWIEARPDRAWLLAGTRRGKVIAWDVRVDSIRSVQEVCLFDGEIYALCWSRHQHLAVFSTEGIFIAEVERSDTELQMRTTSLRPDLRRRAHVSLAEWRKSDLLYCTAGQVHAFNATTGSQGSICLEGSVEDEACSMRPASGEEPEWEGKESRPMLIKEHYPAICALQNGAWRVTVQDGSEYSISTDALFGATEFITPGSHLPPANEAIGSLQRTVEAARGLLAKEEDKAGLTFTCHDANSIAPWAFFRDPKCQLGLSLSWTPIAAREVAEASRLIDAALHGDYVHLRALIVFYMRNSKKDEILALLLSALQRQSLERTFLQSAIRLSVWVEEERARDGKKKANNNGTLNTLRQLGMAASLRRSLTSLQADSTKETIVDPRNASFCLILSAAARNVGERTSDADLISDGQRMSQGIVSNLIAPESGFIDAGEKCPACASQVYFNSESFSQARCQKGHLWKRCSVSFALLTTSWNRVCSICSQESIRPEDAQAPMQQQLLQSMTACNLCGGKLFLHV